MIHTAGTTGFPKIVPLTQDNLLFAMLANCDVLGLTPLDRCLGVMPLCHIHGLGAVLCSLLSGGSIIVNRAFTPERFFDSLARLARDWYTAVPAIHQLVLERAAAHEAVVRGSPSEKRSLRPLGSAPMPRGVPERLERAVQHLLRRGVRHDRGVGVCPVESPGLHPHRQRRDADPRHRRAGDRRVRPVAWLGHGG